MKLTKEFKVSASTAGADECMSVMGVFEVVQDAITELMGDLKADGITAKNKYNAFWVFVKNRVKIFKKVLWNEKFTVTCFISAKSLVKLIFDVLATNASNEPIFYARVESCALDIPTQRIRKIATVGVDDSVQPENAIMDLEFSKFDYANLPLFEQIKIRSTNIDMSHHTNNLEYLRFVLNTYGVNELIERPIKEIEVIYANQSFENDVINVLKLKDENKDAIVLEKDNKPIIKCEILF